MSTNGEDKLILEGLKERVRELQVNCEDISYQLTDAAGVDEKDVYTLAEIEDVDPDSIWRKVGEGNMEIINRLEEIHNTMPTVIEDPDFIDDHFEQVVAMARKRGVELEECAERIMAGEWRLNDPPTPPRTDRVVYQPQPKPVPDHPEDATSMNIVRRTVDRVLNTWIIKLRPQNRGLLEKIRDMLGPVETWIEPSTGAVREYDETKAQKWLDDMLEVAESDEERKVLEDIKETLNSQ